MRSANSFKWLVLVGLPIIMWQCYWYVGFSQEITKMLNFVVSFILLVMACFEIFKGKKSGYENYLRWMVILFLISMVTSFLYWGQSPSLTFRAGVSNYVILYFFILKKYKVTQQELYKLVFIFAGIYVVLWGYAVSQAPRVVFGNLEEVNDSRGFVRILQLHSLDTVCLFFFMAFVNSMKKRDKFKWILLAAGCFLVVFLALSRMLIFSVIIVAFFFILRKRKLLAVVVSIAFVLAYNTITQSEVVTNMIGLTQNQIQDDKASGLRMPEYTYAFTAYPFNIGTFLLGNGAPHIQSEYGKYDDKLKYTMSFNLSDAGYVAVFITNGIAMVLLLVFLLLKVFRTLVPFQYQPFRLYIISLFINCITSYAFWSSGISFAICLYALSIIPNSKSEVAIIIS